MKEVILSADSESVVYSVPDIVAENLETYCMEFCNKWLRNSPEAKKYRIRGGVCYTEEDFIEYLNRYLFPREKSKPIKNLRWTDLGKNLPEQYRHYPHFNF